MIYSDALRAEVTALAISLGPSGDRQASKVYGVPRRTIRRWVALVRHGDPRGVTIVSAESREQVAERFWSVVSTGTERMQTALADPKTPARDVARLVEVSFASHSLMSGGPTSRTETISRRDPGETPDDIQWWEQVAGGPLTEDERRFLRDSMDYGEEWLMAAIVRELKAARAEDRPPVTLDARATNRLPLVSKPAQITDGRNGS